MKKLLSLVLVLMLLFSVSSSSFAEDEAPIVTAMLNASQIPADENTVLSKIREITGIDFRPTVLENTDYEQKFVTAAASNNMPDIFYRGGYTKVTELIDSGKVLALNDLLESNGQDILANHAGAENGSIVDVKGNIYGLVYSQARLSALMIRQDWLDNLNLEMPTTIDEFYDVLHAFTYDDPDGDGEQDTIGLAATMAFPTTIQCLFTMFGVPHSRPVMVDGEVKPYFMHPAYMDAVNFARKLYSEGLMETEFATIPNMDCLGKLWNGQYGCYYGDPIGTTNNWFPTRYTEDPLPVMTYTAILNDEGIGGALSPVYETFFFISSSAKNPEAAMDILNFFCTEEGNALAYAGIQGYHWDWTDDHKLQYLGEFADATAQRADGVYAYCPCLRFDGLERQILTEITQYGYQVADAHIVPDAYIMTKPEIEANLTFDDAEMLANLIVTEEDPDALYETYISEYLAAGGSTWIEQATEIYAIEKGL